MSTASRLPSPSQRGAGGLCPAARAARGRHVLEANVTAARPRLDNLGAHHELVRAASFLRCAAAADRCACKVCSVRLALRDPGTVQRAHHGRSPHCWLSVWGGKRLSGVWQKISRRAVASGVV